MHAGDPAAAARTRAGWAALMNGEQPKMADQKKAEQGASAPDLQKAADEAEEKGYYGIEVDPTPNEAYTVQGVAAKQPTPETDAGAQAKADENLAKVEAQLSGKSDKG